MFYCSELHLANKYMCIDATSGNLTKHFSKQASLHGCANEGLDNTSLKNTVPTFILDNGFIDFNFLILYLPLSLISCDQVPDFTVVFFLSLESFP